MVPLAARAATVQISIGELGEAIGQSGGQPDAVQILLASRLQQQLSSAGLQVLGGELVLARSYNDVTIEDGCTRSLLRSLDLQVVVNDDTDAAFELNSIYDPVERGATSAAHGSAGAQSRVDC